VNSDSKFPKSPHKRSDLRDPRTRQERERDEEVICLCNEVRRETIEKAIREGAHSMNEIFDKTTAGVGPCGGSCRRILQPLLEGYLRDGQFPEGSLRRGKGRKS
jgi:bacterioferritin-associated ferredoxin